MAVTKATTNNNNKAVTPAFVKAIAQADLIAPKNVYLSDGTHRLRVKELDMGSNKDGAPCLFVHFEVLESDNPAHRVGSTVTVVEKPMSPYSAGRIKTMAFLFERLVLGEQPDDADAEAIVMSLFDAEESKRYVGSEVTARVETRPQLKDPNKTFTHVYLDA